MSLILTVIFLAGLIVSVFKSGLCTLVRPVLRHAEGLLRAIPVRVCVRMVFPMYTNREIICSIACGKIRISTSTNNVVFATLKGPNIFD